MFPVMPQRFFITPVMRNEDILLIWSYLGVFSQDNILLIYYIHLYTHDCKHYYEDDSLSLLANQKKTCWQLALLVNDPQLPEEVVKFRFGEGVGWLILPVAEEISEIHRRDPGSPNRRGWAKGVLHHRNETLFVFRFLDLPFSVSVSQDP